METALGDMSSVRAGRRVPTVVLASLLLSAALAGTAQATPEAERTPRGFRQVDHESLARGVVHRTLVGRDPRQVVHVAQVDRGAPVALRPVVARGGEAGGAVERTSSMCARVRCLVGVNADFFTPAGVPLGGIAVNDEPVRSPNSKHHQLIVKGGVPIRSAPVRWSGLLVPTDLEGLTIDGVNVERGKNETVLYTPRFGASTGGNRFGTELVVRPVMPRGPVRLGQTSIVRLERMGSRGGDTPIPENGAVLSAHGAAATRLLALWKRVARGTISRDVLLRISSDPDLTDTVGGTPILVRDGRRWFTDEPRSFVRARHPRTMVGWTKAGEVLLVTVDGRQPGYSSGMSLREAADLMLGLGAVEALNLDGGGSTTFVLRGRVVNRPSDLLVRRAGERRLVRGLRRSDVLLGNVERPVAVALALVPASGDGSAPDPIRPGRLRPPAAVQLPPPRGVDAASDPLGAYPAVVVAARPPAALPQTMFVVALLLIVLNAGALAAHVARRSARSTPRS